MRHTDTYISIPTPCHENWHAMIPAQQGRYCAACQKTVIDFSLMTDAEVLNILKRKDVDTSCGNFSVTQLGRPIVDNTYHPSFVRNIARRAASLLILFQSVSTVALAQQKLRGKNAVVHHPRDQRPVSEGKRIKGKVIDAKTNLPLAGIPVFIKAIHADTITNAAGEFVFILPQAMPDSELTITCRKTPATEKLTIPDERVLVANIVAGKDIVMYAYTVEMLPNQKVAEFIDMPTLRYGRFNVDSERGASDINAKDVHPPAIVAGTHRSFWSRIAAPFKRKANAAN